MTIVLLGVKRDADSQIEKYQFAEFDSDEYKQGGKPFGYWRATKDVEGPIFYADGTFKLRFHTSGKENLFHYSTFDNFDLTREERDRFFEKLFTDTSKRSGISDEKARIIAKKTLSGHRTKQIQREALLMPFGSIWETLAEVHIGLKDIDAKYDSLKGEHVKPLFQIMGELFPTDSLRNYMDVDRGLLLPEHRELKMADVY